MKKTPFRHKSEPPYLASSQQNKGMFLTELDAFKKTPSPSYNLKMKTIWFGARRKKFRYRNLT